MSIERHYNKTATTKRMMATDDSSGFQELETVLTDLACHVQPLEDSISPDITGGFGKDFLMFCAIVNLKEGDRVFIDNDEYRVVSMEKLRYMGQPKHIEARIRIYDAN